MELVNHPRRIGDWTIGEALGKGGNGTVFAAASPSQTGALKHSNSKNPARWRRFTDEIEAMRRCADIRGVLPILDAGTITGGRPWFVMGRAIAMNAHLGPSPPLRACVEAMRDIATTLAAMHARGISHRDVKPENLFRYKDQWAVGDFGLAHFEGKKSVTQSGERVGPIHYIAPEMLNEAGKSDGRAADVFSLGKTLWVLATGQAFPLPGHYTDTFPPFRISSYITAERTAPLDALVRTCTQDDPKARPSMVQVAAELSSWLAPSEVARAPIALDVGNFAAELARQHALIETNQKREAQRTASRERHGRRIREALRPLAVEVADTLKAVGFQNVGVNIENHYYGFQLGGHIPRAPDLGARLELLVGIGIDDDQVRITGHFTAHPIRTPGGLSMVIWDKNVAFLAEGSQEAQMLAVMQTSIREQLQRAVDVVMRLALRPDSDPEPHPALIPGSVTIRDSNGPVHEAMLTLLFANGLYKQCPTNHEGLATFHSVPATSSLRAFVSHSTHPGVIVESSPLHGTILMPGKSDASGSVVATAGWTVIPNFPHSLNFILDSQNRRYVYAENMTINGDIKQPANVSLGIPLSIEDGQGHRVTLVPRAFHGACFLLDIRN
jgi:hypothetical protein